MLNRLLIGVAILFAVIVAACIWIMAQYTPGLSVGRAYLEASIVAKLVTMAIVPLGLCGLIFGLIPARTATLVVAAFTAGLGLLGALFGEVMTQSALRRVGPVSFEVTAPARVEALLVLAFGLGVALIALAALRLRTR